MTVALNMKLTTSIITGLSTSSLALSLSPPPQAVLDASALEDRYLIELGPGETRWIKEEEKWALRRVCTSFCPDQVGGLEMAY